MGNSYYEGENYGTRWGLVRGFVGGIIIAFLLFVAYYMLKAIDLRCLITLVIIIIVSVISLVFYVIIPIIKWLKSGK